MDTVMPQTLTRYFQYWGKTKKKLEIDYCQGVVSLPELVKSYDWIDSLEHLQRLAAKNDWQRLQPGEHFPRYHLLAYHSLDVAAVGKLMLEQNLFGTDAVIARLTDDKAAFIDFFTYALALHDVGKFACGFQSLRQFESDHLAAIDDSYSYNVRHDSLGYVLWRETLEAVLLADFSGDQGWALADSMDVMIKLVTGHHGTPPNEMKNSQLIALRYYFKDEDIDAAKQWLSACQFLRPERLPDFLFDEDQLPLLKSLSWVFAGITILADWLGSDQTIFTYQEHPVPLPTYWQSDAIPKAQKKLIKDGYGTTVKLANFDKVKTLIPYIEHPTPLQEYCRVCDLDTGPQLFMLEDVTGAGKTEAALILAQRLLSENGTTGTREGSGLYIALPTMATSNAMFERMEEVYQHFFCGEKTPSLVLAHGARHLSKRFTDMIGLTEQPQDQNYQTDEQSATGWCNYWFVDNRKKSLLADVGVGTVDQALLGVLPARHQSMRLLGLSQKVLIIDEVHSYSTYESRLIQALIKFHTSLGGTTILLSATMPYLLRQELVKAYAAGLSVQLPLISKNADFPWVSQLGMNIGLNEQAVESRACVSRTVKVNYQTNEADIWQLIESSLAQGKSVCWIKNTVNETIECFDEANSRLAGIATKITLFHSRFCMADRIDTETMVLEQFGKHSTAEKRQGQLLISSPILDQSLDVDMSIMISDVAPMDVLIQRLGRCCRHLRNADESLIKPVTDQTKDGRGQAMLYLHGPEFTDTPAKDWLSEFSSGTQAIYKDTLRIWLTVKTLQAEQAITMPGKARHLIESVYGPEVIEDTPQVLQDIHQKVSGEQAGESFLATFNQLDVAQGYSLGSNYQGWCDESDIPTRLADDTVDFVLLINEDGQLRFYADKADFAVDMSKISVRKTFIAKCDPAVLQQHQAQIEALQTEYRQLEYCQLLILTESVDGSWQGMALDHNDKQLTVTYDQCKGLQK
jgi:CRISPR-associated endonuclease/helicase Cas3